MLVDKMSFGQRPQHSSRGDRGIFQSFFFGKQHNEFIPAVPTYRVRTAYAVYQAFSHRFKKLVASGVPERIVDVLETVQIQE